MAPALADGNTVDDADDDADDATVGVAQVAATADAGAATVPVEATVVAVVVSDRAVWTLLAGVHGAAGAAVPVTCVWRADARVVLSLPVGWRAVWLALVVLWESCVGTTWVGPMERCVGGMPREAGQSRAEHGGTRAHTNMHGTTRQKHM